MKKRFIEWDLPLKEISQESAKEKNIRHGHPSTLHIWWARRPLASSRVTNFAALIDLPDNEKERQEITELIKRITKWDAVKNGNNQDIKKAQELLKKQWGNNPPKVIDPFGGGGSIPLEALRLGCETYSNDLNPVAVLIQKATIEWPQRFGKEIEIELDEKTGEWNEKREKSKKSKVKSEKEETFHLSPFTFHTTTKKVNQLAYYVEKYANEILEEVKQEIERFYPDDEDGSKPVGYIWARTIPCQNISCGIEIPLIKQFWLCKKPNKKVAYKIVVCEKSKVKSEINNNFHFPPSTFHTDSPFTFHILEDDNIDFNPEDGTVKRGDVCCPVCGNVIKAADTRRLFQEGKNGERMIAVVLHKQGETGKKYRLATDKDIAVFKEAEKYLEKKLKDWKWDCDPLPEENLEEKSVKQRTPWLYNIKQWKDLFNSRQKLALVCFLDKIKKICEKSKKDSEKWKVKSEKEELQKAVIGYMNILLNRTSIYSTNMAYWHVSREIATPMFGRQAIAMMWDYCETNPISDNFSFSVQIDWVLRVINNCSNLSPFTFHLSPSITNLSATQLPYPDNHFDLVSTDPPYYDAINYAELSDFFYVWFKKSLSDLFPELFATPLTPKSNEAVANPIRHGSVEKAKQHFEKMLSDSFKEMYRILKTNGIAIIVYAHKTISGWETMLNSLMNAGFVVTGSWPINTEMGSRLNANETASLASSIYMVCRKIKREKIGFYNEIKEEIKKRVEEKMKQFWNEGISGGDFFISAIGPGMEIFSQFEKVEKLSGEEVSTVELLDYIRKVSTDWITNQLLQGAEAANIDKEARFYLAYRWTYFDATVPFDDAFKLANASGIDITQYWSQDGFIQKKGSEIKVLGPKERKNIKQTQNMVDIMHKALSIWEEGDKTKLVEFLAITGQQKNNAFFQFCQAVSECLINNSKEKQLLQGFLLSKESIMKQEKIVDKQMKLL